MTYLYNIVCIFQKYKQQIKGDEAFTAFPSCFKMDGAQARVAKAVTTMVSSLDKESLRKLQVSATGA